MESSVGVKSEKQKKIALLREFVHDGGGRSYFSDMFLDKILGLTEIYQIKASADLIDGIMKFGVEPTVTIQSDEIAKLFDDTKEEDTTMFGAAMKGLRG